MSFSAVNYLLSAIVPRDLESYSTSRPTEAEEGGAEIVSIFTEKSDFRSVKDTLLCPQDKYPLQQY